MATIPCDLDAKKIGLTEDEFKNVVDAFRPGENRRWRWQTTTMAALAAIAVVASVFAGLVVCGVCPFIMPLAVPLAIAGSAALLATALAVYQQLRPALTSQMCRKVKEGMYPFERGTLKGGRFSDDVMQRVICRAFGSAEEEGEERFRQEVISIAANLGLHLDEDGRPIYSMEGSPMEFLHKKVEFSWKLNYLFQGFGVAQAIAVEIMGLTKNKFGLCGLGDGLGVGKIESFHFADRRPFDLKIEYKDAKKILTRMASEVADKWKRWSWQTIALVASAALAAVAAVFALFMAATTFPLVIPLVVSGGSALLSGILAIYQQYRPPLERSVTALVDYLRRTVKELAWARSEAKKPLARDLCKALLFLDPPLAKEE